jgi:hypothetical protein
MPGPLRPDADRAGAPHFEEGAAPGWGIISTPLPLGFPGRVIVAKPGDPTRRRSTKCPRGGGPILAV